MHYGVRGMRWGVRKKSGSSSKTSKSKPAAEEHSDSKKATEILSKAKGKQGSKAKALSNKELEEAIYRLNLEKRLADLAPVRDSFGTALLKRFTGNTQRGAEAAGQQVLNTKMADLLREASKKGS